MATLSLSDLEIALARLDLSTPFPQVGSADVLNQPLDLHRSYLADVLSSLMGVDVTAAYNAIQLSNDPMHGDFTVVLPKLFPGIKPGKPAADLIDKFPTEHPLFGLPWLDGVQLRLCVKSDTFSQLLIPFITDRKDDYGFDSKAKPADGQDPERSQKRLIVEFSSPNISSEFQGKNLRSTLLGEFVSKIHDKQGWQVTRLNYLGDWGKDIALLGIGWEKFGSEDAFEHDPGAHLLDVYNKIHELFLPEQAASKAARDEAKKKGDNEQEVTAEIEGKGLFAERNAFFKRMEEGDESAVALCKRIRDVNINNYTKFYARLGIAFDEYSGESLIKHDTMAQLENLMKEKGLLEDIGDASGIDMKNCGGKTGIAIIRDRSGSSTYFLRYLAAVLERSREIDFDKMIFVAADRTGHYSRLIKVFEALGMNDLAGKLQHVSFSDTSHMIEKLGHGHQPDSILDQCEAGVVEALKANEKASNILGSPEHWKKELGTAAILAQEFSTKRSSEHAFDQKTMSLLKPGYGPYIQVWYAKLHAHLQTYPPDLSLPSEAYSSLMDDDHTSLLLTLGQFPEVIHAALKSLEPNGIVSYLNNVIDHVEGFLDEDEDDEEDKDKEVEVSEEIKQESGDTGVGAEDDDAPTPAELMLHEAARQVLENGMKLLGFAPLGNSQNRVDTPVAE